MNSHSLNHIYRLVWNAVTQTWVAVAEVTRGRSKPGKSRKARLALAAALMATGAAQADPAGGVVTSGVGKISQSANSTVIQQQSQNLQLQWQSFNVGAGQSVTFQQPSASALAVNRILDTNGSRILGNINANGQVWLINPNGVFFGRDAQVNVGGLLASTLNPMGTASDGQQSFAKAAGSATGSVVNEGRLTAAEGGYIALLGEQVRNQGVISAQLGTVALAGGSAVSLNFSGHQLLGVEVNQSTLENLASNQQLIKADGGQVFMSAGAKDSLLASAVNNSGTIEAQTIQEKNGRIILMGGMAAGTTTVAGKLDASAPNGGNGGFVETSASVVKVAGDAVVTTKAAQGSSGTWLLDPTDFNIDAGAGAGTSSSIGADTLSANLANGNVTIQTVNNSGTDKGDINVNADVSWSTDNKLTLSAYRDIVFNASLTATGAAGKVALEYGQGAVAAGNTATYDFGMTNNNSFTARINLKEGDNFSTKLGTDGYLYQYKVVTRLGSSTDTVFDAFNPIKTLQGMSPMTGTHFVLGADIDASATSGWNGGQGFSPLGPGDANNFPNFYGGFDGLGHIITGLTINRPDTNYVGLFTRKGPNTFGEGFALRNVGLVNASVTGHDYVGILAGQANGQITNVFATGNVSARRLAGGLAGTVGVGPVSWGLAYVDSVYAKVNVTASRPGEPASSVGGLFGQAAGDGLLEGTIYFRRAYATGNVTATDGEGVGGLIGTSTARIADTFASGNVTGLDSNTPDMFGGLRKSYYVGGLVGRRATGSSVVNSYSRGVVSGSTAGGLVGGNVPNQSQSVTTSFWDTQASGRATSPAGTGKTTAEMQARATFADAGWNIEGQGGAYPVLTFSRTAATWLIGLPATRVTYSLSPITGYTYSGQAVELGSLWNAGSIFGNTYSSWALGTDYSFSFGGNAVTGFTNAGTYSNIGVNVLNSAFAAANTGNTKGSLVIAPKAVTVSGLTVADKAYDGSTTATVNTAGAVYTGLVTGEALSTTATGSFASKNASATAQVVSLAATTIAGANTLLSNYTVVEQASTTARITPKAVTVSGITAANKAYDGNTTATVNTASAVYTGLVTGEALSTTATGSFASKDASATAQTVNLSATTSAGANTSLDNYTVTEQASTSARITPKAVTVSGITAADKDYDGSTSATANTAGAVYTGLVAGEALSTTATGTFASKDASATAQTVTLAASTTAGANTSLSNYTVTEQASTTAKINKKAVTVSGIAAANKAYDGTTAATVSTAGAVYAGLVSGEALSTTATGSFASKNASAAAQSVTLAASTTAGANTSLANYAITEQTSTTARITPKAVTVSGITAADKAYDGSTTATVNTAGAVYTGLVTGEALSTTATGNFAGKDASATAQTVSLAATTSAGANTSLSNYTVTEQANTTAKINKKAVTVSGITAADKAYDGSTTATVNTAGAVYTGLVTGEAMNTTATGSFASKDASATAQTVTLAASTTAGANTSLSNYTVTEQASTTAKIDKKAVTVSGIAAANKAYDGTTAATVSTAGAVYAGLVSGEALSTTATGSFASKNASAAAQSVTLAASTTAGANTSLANYAITEQTSTTARITPKAVTVSGITAADKAYDGSTTATVNTAGAVYTGLVTGEALSTTATGNFAGKDASATAQTVSLAATTSAGANTSLSNYTVTEQASTSARITPKAVTVSGITATDKAYDGSTTATVNTAGAVYTGLVTGEAMNTTATGSFASKDASATAQTVTLAASTTAGANTSLSNYTVTEQASTTAKIDKKAVTVSGITAADKAYDGSTTATVNTASAVYAGLVSGEALSTTATGSFASKNASATVQNVSLAATTTAGANTSLANYTVAEQASTTARITPKAVTVSGITAADKAYDGSTTATVNTAGAVFTGLVTGEALSTTATGNFAGKDASATAQTVSLAATTSAGANTSLSNYTVTEQASTTAKITPKAVTVSGLTVADKAYDGSTAVAVNTSGAVYDGLVAGEALSTTATGNFAGKDASATAQTVSLAATTSAGANTSLSNYTVTEQASTTARITPKAVTVSGLTVADKVYDSSTAVAVNTSGAVYNGLVAGEAMSTTATGSFASKNASAAAQIVTLAATTTAGANTKLANYTVTEQTSATARVTPKAVTVSGIAVADKTYDGGTTATVDTSNAKYEGLVAGETLSTAASGVFENKNAADNKTVTLTATTTAGPGTLLSNYQVTEQASASTSVHKKVLTVAATASDKVYDSTSTAGVTLTAQGVVAGDKVLVNRTGADFVDGQGVANGNVGTNKSVMVTGVSLSGSDSANYSLGRLVSVDAKASISPATLTYVAAPASVILGQPLQLTGSVTGLVGRDTLADALTGTAVWTIDGDMNVPGTKGVVGGGLSANAGNYIFRQALGNGAALEVKPGSPPLQVQAITTNLQRGQGNLPTQLTTGHVTQAPSRSAYLPPVLSTDPGMGTLQVVNRGLNVPNNLLIGTDE